MVGETALVLIEDPVDRQQSIASKPMFASLDRVCFAARCLWIDHC